jgi:CHAT domain-containing protein/Tfp pilus assembly protein PilF
LAFLITLHTVRGSRALRGLSRAACAALSVISLSFASAAQQAPAAAPAGEAAKAAKESPLPPKGEAVERELAADEVHAYNVSLSAGQFLEVSVEQRGVDVKVSAFGPDGRLIFDAARRRGKEGTEAVALVTEASGAHRVEVRPWPREGSGRYQLKVLESRPAAEKDLRRVEAMKALEEAARSIREGKPEALRRALGPIGVAARIWRELGERREEGSALNLMAWVHWRVNEYQEAISRYEEALPLYRALGDRKNEAELLGSIGFTYRYLDELQKALDYYNQSLAIQQEMGDRGGVAKMFGNIAVIYYRLGEHQREMDYLQRALAIWRELGDTSGEAVVLNNMGASYRALGEAQKALEHFNGALKLWRDLEDRDGVALSMNNLGTTYDLLGEREKALEHFTEALRMRREMAERIGEAAALHNMGKSYAAMGESRKALEHFGQALSLRQAVTDRSGVASTLYEMARSERALQNLDGARARVEAALELVDELRVRIASPELRASYFSTVHKYSDFYIDLLMRLHLRQPSEGHDVLALQASERARARSLLEALVEARVDIRSGVEPSLLARERSLQRELNGKTEQRIRLLSGGGAPAELAALEREIERLLTQLREVESELRTRSPRYAALTRPQPLSLPDIQRRVVDEDTLLLEYSLGEEQSFVWAVSNTSVRSFVLPKRAEVEAAARRAYELLTARNTRLSFEDEVKKRMRVGAADAEYEEAAAELSRMVLGPVAESLKGKRRLLVVAEGALQYMPFSALPAPSASGRRPVYAPLILQHEVTSAPSASVLAMLRSDLARRRPASKAVAVFADPVFGRSDPRVSRVAERGTGGGTDVGGAAASPPQDSGTRGALVRAVAETRLAGEPQWLTRLPYSRTEAEGILALVPAADRLPAFGFAASREMAVSPELSRYRYLHFATHSLINSQHPELSGIVLSLVDANGADRDGFLRSYEVYNLQLPAEMVVLSACSTGLGKDVRGEGLMGLTRGFMYAGAARTTVSLWDVDDVATAALMARMYRGILGKERLRPLAALRAAQIEMWRQGRWRAPYYWAAFTMHGEWR